MLIKIRLLETLQALRNANIIGAKVPPEILCQIRKEILACSGLAHRRDLLRMNDFTELIEEIKAQIIELYCRARQINRHFWPSIVESFGKYSVQTPDEALRHKGKEMAAIFRSYTEVAADSKQSTIIHRHGYLQIEIRRIFLGLLFHPTSYEIVPSTAEYLGRLVFQRSEKIRRAQPSESNH